MPDTGRKSGCATWRCRDWELSQPNRKHREKGGKICLSDGENSVKIFEICEKRVKGRDREQKGVLFYVRTFKVCQH